MLYIRSAGDKGRGVFAEKSFKQGDVIERAPVVAMPVEQEKHLDQTFLHHYYYDWGGTQIMVALGYGSLYNHSYNPNAVYRKNFTDSVLEFIARRDIEPNEEITVNYNGDPEDQAPLWFEVLS